MAKRVRKTPRKKMKTAKRNRGKKAARLIVVARP